MAPYRRCAPEAYAAGPRPKNVSSARGHKTRQVPHGRPQGHSPGAWHAPSCLPELAPRGATPRCPVCWARVLESREAGAGGRDGAAIGVKNAVLRRGRTHARCEPSEGGRAPIGPAAGAARVSEPKGGEMTRGGWASAHGLFPRSRQVAPGVRCALGDRDRGASARAREAGEVHRLAAVGVDAPPSRRALFCPATESASRHQGRPQRRRAEGWPWRAADGGVAPWHRGGCQGCRGRRPSAHRGEPPCRYSVCEPATGVPAELRVAGVPSGGTGFGKRTRVTSEGNRPPSAGIMSRLLRTA